VSAAPRGDARGDVGERPVEVWQRAGKAGGDPSDATSSPPTRMCGESAADVASAASVGTAEFVTAHPAGHLVQAGPVE